MDPITQSVLVTLRVEEMLRERQPRHETGAPWYGGPPLAAATRPAGPLVFRHLRRSLGAFLIQAGRRLGDGTRPRSYSLHGSAQR